ncbi:MAG: hypothetical protein IJS41_10700 [Clostridia bacterium]|nr:hypothetical protein [Clostridia bacterium]
MNPFQLKPERMSEQFMDWQRLYPRSYDKMEVDPYTRVRVILMNGTEFESAGYSHQFQRHESNNDLRRELAMMRRQEQQQQKKIACLKPMDETVLEHTIGYEQLAVDLTAGLAKRVTCANVKSALDFALLEDFDHLYRYADLMEMEHGQYAEKLVGDYTEIMPGRPTISEHRCPMDALCVPGKPDAALFDKMAVQIITAAEQQTMNYYMNTCALYPTDAGRRLYQEIGLIEEQHVTQYGSLMDPRATMLECLLMHEYTECYLYYSCYMDETDAHVKEVWEESFLQEVAHLHAAADLLKTYEKKDWQQVIPDGSFPKLLKLHENIAYVRGVLESQAQLTSRLENYIAEEKLPDNAPFYAFQEALNTPVDQVPTHFVIQDYMNAHGQDYRWETAEEPVPQLRSRTRDDISVGREKLVKP